MRIGTRLMLALAYVLVLAIVALEIPLAISLRERVDEEVRSQATSTARLTAALAEDQIAEDRNGQLPALAESAANATRGRVVIVDADGAVLADSARGSTGDDFSTRPEVSSALNGREVQYSRNSQTLNEHLLATATPVMHEGKVVGAVRITQSISAQQRAMNRATVGLVIVGLGVLVVGLLVGALIARQIARPLRSFESAARAVEEGDLSARAPVVGSLEQQALAEAFNDMTARVQETLHNQRQFVADASHQLRTPLAGLRLRLEEAQAANDSPAVAAELTHGIAETDRLSRMVDELLVLSEGEAQAAARPVAAHEFAGDVVARWSTYSEAADHQLELVQTGGDFTVLAARGDLDRALDALIENALHYSPAGSTVTVGVGDGVITVDDAGPGLCGDDPEELFTRFHRGQAGRRGVKGTGLGLPIARETARRWGGEVTLTELPGGGTRAGLEFPATGPHSYTAVVSPVTAAHDDRDGMSDTA